MRSKTHSFKCKTDDESKNQLDGVSKSQSKHIKFEENKKFLDGEDSQKNVIIILFDHLILQCIFKKKNQHYLYSIMNDVMKKFSKVYPALNTSKFDRRSES